MPGIATLQIKDEVNLKIAGLELDARRALMQKFEFDMKLAQIDVQKEQAREQSIEDRKDKRTKIQATQQSKMIDQRQNDLLPTDFESDQNSGEVDLNNLQIT